MTVLVDFVRTADGAFGALAREDGTVLASGWTDSTEALLARIPVAHRPEGVRRAAVPRIADAVAAFYDGDPSVIDTIAVEQAGGPFRITAWRALRAIAPGRPLTYTEFAAASGRPAAVRAAASACATNAVALFVPCHRVVRTDGALGGFAWGVEVKRSLLAREAAAR
ncbi:MAG: methylated-DNA--protein-cysteine methyltransferase [Naasia sp.]|jgi:methylated-DNA-[protein]-cysteine S-methyltransferase|uniref:methylated-DNA--[protein]-cysteine S-methyltransferase n=1 Tax=Naasia sp. TaxID=2546198 RepID=UPI0026185F3D|nr:methylated-DNA--[protein]-cysteine S-methyltransferase [Naasia sp.]MCU1571075.1 methylated-DNA--protein-cysteine methyltransferase [Naasia sp.]